MKNHRRQIESGFLFPAILNSDSVLSSTLPEAIVFTGFMATDPALDPGCHYLFPFSQETQQCTWPLARSLLKFLSRGISLRFLIVSQGIDIPQESILVSVDDALLFKK